MDQNELFKNYLEGKLSPADQELLKKLVEENPQYMAQWEEFKKANKKTPSKRARIKSWTISFFIALGIVAAGFFLFYRLGTPPGERIFRSYYEEFPQEYELSGPENPLFEEGLRAYYSKNYEVAIENFERLFIQSESDEVKFYLGISQIAFGRPERGIPILSMVSSKSAILGYSSYYQALGYLSLNKLEEAKNQLEIASKEQTIFASKAKEILGKIK